MFNFRWIRFLFFLISLLFLVGITASLVMRIALCILLGIAFPFAAIILSKICFEILATRKCSQTMDLDPDYDSRFCPSCGKSVPPKEIICKNCLTDLVINCPFCGKIFYKGRNQCPTCGAKN